MKRAIVLFNLGGPSSLDAVQPFLCNMFSDPAILGVPQPFRWVLANVISRRRAVVAKEIYKQMGGRSPIALETEKQQQALEQYLQQHAEEDGYKVFIFQRYWHPTAEEAIKEVRAYQPDEVLLLSLYPQYSTTTTASSVKQWLSLYQDRPTKVVCCYPVNEGFVQANAEMIAEKYREALKLGAPHILFSAHGIPQNRVDRGDPYQMQVEASVKAVMQALEKIGIHSAKHTICYQSKVGPLKWLLPATEHVIEEAAKQKEPILVVPIAFVSEHSETLVELDIEYHELFTEHGGNGYFRVSTVRDHPLFIKGLGDLVLSYRERPCDHTKNNCLINKAI